MKSIDETINGILIDLQEKLPALILSRGLKPIEMYGTGYATDQDKIFLCVFYSDGSFDYSEEVFNFGINLQLPQLTEKESYKYADAINEYIKKMFDQSDHGFASMKWSTSYFSPFKNSSPELFFEVTMTGQQGDCD